MNIDKLAQGEAGFFDRVPIDCGIKLSARCACGGEMVPHPREALTWICDRAAPGKEREGHAYLRASFATLPKSGGTA